MSGADDPADEIAQALEILSVSINGVMSACIDVAAAPPTPDGGYRQLAAELASAGEDITVLAQAMAVLARRFPDGQLR